MLPQAILLVLGLLVAWRPWETFPSSTVLVTAVVLLLVPWGFGRTNLERATVGISVAAGAMVFGALRGLTGWDPATALGQLGLIAAVASVIWLASRSTASDATLRLFALGLALLAVWAVWQVTVGFDRAQLAIAELPSYMQENAIQRLDSGRAFASFVLPGHLAAVLASVLPLLAVGVRRSWSGAAALVGCVLCGVGLVLTYSPIGIALAVAACLAVIVVRRWWHGLLAVALLVTALAAMFIVRPELGQMEPLRLRMDNWRTAAWLWSTSPVAGVGLGGYGQASQAVPFEVGNRPAHAHCLPLEFSAELGIVGIAAMIVATIALVVVVRRVWLTRRALAVAIAVIPLHNLVDFSLYTSAVAIPWALLLGWGLANLRPPEEKRTDTRLRLAVVVAAALAVGISLVHTTSVVVARAAVAEPSAKLRFAQLVRAHRLAPWRLDPIVGVALVALENGDPEIVDEASKIVASNRWLRPHSASMAALASRLQLRQARATGAVAEAWTAADAQPFVTERREDFDRLVDRITGGDVERQE